MTYYILTHVVDYNRIHLEIMLCAEGTVTEFYPFNCTLIFFFIGLTKKENVANPFTVAKPILISA